MALFGRNLYTIELSMFIQFVRVYLQLLRLHPYSAI